MTRNAHIFVLSLLVFVTIITRIWGIGQDGSFMFDEGSHVPSARSYIISGHTTPESLWNHPPLKHILLYGSMKLLGDNPYGWRLKNAVAGILSCFFLFLIAMRLFEDFRIACLATAFLAIDPLHVYLSRTTAEEIIGLLFLLMTLYSALEYMEGKSFFLVLTGLFLGLAFSIKWYFLPSFACIASFIVLHDVRNGELTLPRLLYLLSALLILPFVIYLIPYYSWFARGYGFQEFMGMQVDAYLTHQGYTADMFKNELARSSSAAGWFVKPIVIGARIQENSGWGVYRILMNDFPVWMIAAPAFAYLGYKGIKNRDKNAVLVVLLALSFYLQFLLVNRPMFLYAAVPGLPFVFLAVAFLIVSLIKRSATGDLLFNGLLLATFAWGFYLFPFSTGMPVPEFFYNFLFNVGTSAW